MARSALTGSRIRERRALSGVKQADLARTVGISASYLNLIEHNRRKIGDGMLRRIAEALGVDVAVLAEGAEAALLDGLRDAAAGEGGVVGPERPELERIEEFVGRFPGWAGLLVAQHGRVGLLGRTVEALSDRMTHDPYLSSSLHEVLSAVTSVRSTATILTDTEDIEPEWRARFQRNLHQDAERLAEGAEALVAYLDGAAVEEGTLAAPQEEVEAWLDARNWHLPQLETGAVKVATAVEEGLGATSASARRIAERVFTRYAEDARRLPMPAFRAAAEAGKGDPARLAQLFGVDLAMVLRRMAAVPDARVGLVICDGAGALTLRRAVEGFAVPRFGAACPLWPLYQALSRPMVPVRAVVEMAGRVPARHLVYAICQPVGAVGFDAPPVLEATMLIVPDAGAVGAVQPVGPTCRICPRVVCRARREPSILTEEF